MIASSVTRLKMRGERLVLVGRLGRGAAPTPPSPVALRLAGQTLAQTTPVPHDNGAPDLWTFRFILSSGLGPVLAQGADLSVVADAVELPFSAKAQAARSLMNGDPSLLRDIAAKLRDGFVLTSHGELREPFARRGAGLGAILDHYEHCDRLTREILGYNLHVVGGTLLGAARGGDAIDHDVDFDAAYLSGARDGASLKVEHLALLRALYQRGENVRLVNRNGHVRRRHLKWRASAARGAAVEIDVFPAFIDREGHYCRPTFVRIPDGERLMLPLTRAPFGDREVWTPARMEDKAAAVFGPSWRAPDPFWTKPRFAGVDQALADLTLSDAELLELARDMPEMQAEQLRAALAARPRPDASSA